MRHLTIEDLIEKPISLLIKEYKDKTNKKIPAIAKATGIAKETLYKWEKGTTPSNPAEYVKLLIYLKANSSLEEYINKIIPPVETLDNQLASALLGGNYLYQIRDTSMEPVFKQGCKVVVQEVKELHLIIPGTTYLLIDLNNSPIVRRVYLSDDGYITLVANDEIQYPSYRRAILEVAKMYIIKSIITQLQ